MFILYSPFKVYVIKERSMPIRARALYLYNRGGIIAYNSKTSYHCKKIFFRQARSGWKERSTPPDL
jgi:hypothetical protein